MMSSNCSVDPPTETMPTVLPLSSSAELIGLSFAEITWNVDPWYSVATQTNAAPLATATNSSIAVSRTNETAPVMSCWAVTDGALTAEQRRRKSLLSQEAAGDHVHHFQKSGMKPNGVMKVSGSAARAVRRLGLAIAAQAASPPAILKTSHRMVVCDLRLLLIFRDHKLTIFGSPRECQAHNLIKIWIPVAPPFAVKASFFALIMTIQVCGSHPDGGGHADERFVTVLEIPPAVSPETAVKMAIIEQANGK